MSPDPTRAARAGYRWHRLPGVYGSHYVEVPERTALDAATFVVPAATVRERGAAALEHGADHAPALPTMAPAPSRPRTRGARGRGRVRRERRLRAHARAVIAADPYAVGLHDE